MGSYSCCLCMHAYRLPMHGSGIAKAVKSLMSLSLALYVHTCAHKRGSSRLIKQIGVSTSSLS